MKEIFEAVESRIKSPVFGYFTLAFLVVNWKVIFYLLVEKKGVAERVANFENNTDIYSLLIFPIILAAAVSVFYPWVNYCFLFLCKKPTDLKNRLQAEAEHKLLIKRKELEEARSALLSTAEAELIERAKRDEELNEIDDLEVKEKLKLELERLRKERDGFEVKSHSVTAFDESKKLLDIAGTLRDRAEKTRDPNDSEELKAKASKLEMEANNLI